MKCSTCPESFKNAINLLKHAQLIHKLEIFQLEAANAAAASFGKVNNSGNDDLEHEICDDVISSTPATATATTRKANNSKSQNEFFNNKTVSTNDDVAASENVVHIEENTNEAFINSDENSLTFSSASSFSSHQVNIDFRTASKRNIVFFVNFREGLGDD